MPRTTQDSKRKTRRAGLRDVARLAGVAPMTVSRAFSAPEAVARSTRERIHEVAASVGYIPNLVASSLSSNQTRLIGAVIPSFQTSVATDFTSDMETVLKQRGYQLLLGATNFSIDEEEKLVLEFLARRADGIYLTGSTHTERTRRMLEDSGVPVVEVASVGGEPIDLMVGFSNTDAAFAMTRHLAECGFRKIAYFGLISKDNDRQVDRLAGFRMGVEAFGLDPDPGLIDEVPFGLSEAARHFRALLERRPDVEAVFCAADLVAAGVLFECHRLGKRVPQDVAIAGFDGIELAEQVFPPLTTVHLPHQAIGRHAAELLLDRIAGNEIAAPVLDLGFTIVERATTRGGAGNGGF